MRWACKKGAWFRVSILTDGGVSIRSTNTNISRWMLFTTTTMSSPAVRQPPLTYTILLNALDGLELLMLFGAQLKEISCDTYNAYMPLTSVLMPGI